MFKTDEDYFYRGFHLKDNLTEDVHYKVVDDEAQALPLGSHIKTKHVDAEPSMPEKSYYWLPQRYDTLSPIAWDQALKVVANLFAFGFETDGIASNELLPESIFNN